MSGIFATHATATPGGCQNVLTVPVSVSSYYVKTIITNLQLHYIHCQLSLLNCSVSGHQTLCNVTSHYASSYGLNYYYLIQYKASLQSYIINDRLLSLRRISKIRIGIVFLILQMNLRRYLLGKDSLKKIKWRHVMSKFTYRLKF